MKWKIQHAILAGVLSAAVCLTNVSTVFASETDPSLSGTVQTESQTEEASEEASENVQSTSGESAETNSSSSDVENTGDGETSTDDTASQAVQVSDDIQKLVSAAAQVTELTDEQVAQISQKLEETQNSLEALPEEEQQILSDSKNVLKNAAEAVDSYQNPEQTGDFLVAEDGHQNSFRYLNGQPVQEAEQDVAQENDAIQAYADGEPDTVVQGLKDGTITTAEGENASYQAASSETLGADTQAVLLGNSAALEGVDVSQWQGKIDWAAVKNAGIRFAILRCGWGENSTSQDDRYFTYNAEQCEEYGIPYGVYLYSYAVNTSGAASEAEHVIRLLQGRNITLPAYIDMEENGQYALGNSGVTSIASAFCSTVKAAGYNAGIYASTNWWNSVLASMAQDTGFYHWVAQWNDTVTANAAYQLWQYSSTGSVSGISGGVDTDRWYGDFPSGVTRAATATSDGTGVEYQTHVQNIGWESYTSQNGETSGTTGQSLRLEAIRIRLTGNSNVGISYSTHVQNIGWQNAVSDWAQAGTTGQGLRLEAIRINLTGADADKYDIYYRVHAQNIGWMGWARNGEAAGTQGYSLRLEAVQIVLLDKGAEAPSNAGAATTEAFRQNMISYSAHVQNIGWQQAAANGATAGTTGQGLRMEAVKIDSSVVDLQYRTHIQNIGWQNGWTSKGQVSGTTGRALRLEAIQIQLTGASASQYDIYYRTHIQNIGWTGWASNGAACGSAGYYYRMEAIEIVLVQKGAAAPGSTANAFYQK